MDRERYRVGDRVASEELGEECLASRKSDGGKHDEVFGRVY